MLAFLNFSVVYLSLPIALWRLPDLFAPICKGLKVVSLHLVNLRSRLEVGWVNIAQRISVLHVSSEVRCHTAVENNVDCQTALRVHLDPAGFFLCK